MTEILKQSTREGELLKVQSRDGTRIACSITGQGPPLVLVHGGFADHSRWGPVIPALSERFTVYSVDRRGRGESGDSKEYSIEREFEDIAAVVDSIPAPVNLLGHSYGGRCCLEAALRTRNIRKLILYEPAGGGALPTMLIARIQTYVEAGDRERAVLTFMTEGLRMPSEQIEKARSLPSWKARLAAVHTVPRELDAVKLYVFSPGRFANFDIPTLVLTGSESPSFIKEATKAVHEALQNSRIVVMAGEGHAAGGLPGPGAQIFATEVIKFLVTSNGEA